MTYSNVVRRRVRHLARVAGITLSFALLASANAMGCDDNNRPGTPYPTRVEIHEGQIWFIWKNTQHEGGRYYDYQITDSAGHIIRDISGRDFLPGFPPQRLFRYGDEVTDTEDLPYNGTQYCFIVRARTDSGKNGCVSHEWAKPACATTPTAAVDALCQSYAMNAVNQVAQISKMQPVGECSNWKANPRWDGDSYHHYQACIGWRAQGQTLDVNETNERARILKTCVPLGKTAATAKPPTAAPASQKPAQACANVTVQITNQTCTNGDGSPMTSNPPGALTTVGCGQTEDAATQLAKQAFYQAQGPCLDDGKGAPLAGCCTYTTKVVSKSVCACPGEVHSLKRYNSCGGAKPVGTAPFCCPAGSVYSNGACHNLRAANASPQTTPAPVATAPAQIDRSFMAGTDLPGSDYRNAALNDNNATTCKTMCATDAKCLAWTWVKPGVQNAKAMCWLKNAVPPSHPNPNVTSGIKVTNEVIH